MGNPGESLLSPWDPTPLPPIGVTRMPDRNDELQSGQAFTMDRFRRSRSIGFGDHDGANFAPENIRLEVSTNAGWSASFLPGRLGRVQHCRGHPP